MSSTFSENEELRVKNAPPIAGGAAEPGESLCADTKYMDADSAETAQRWVESWRHMSREEFEKSADCL